MIPMAATGHVTIYVWCCNRTVSTTVISRVDMQGFELLNWKPDNKPCQSVSGCRLSRHEQMLVPPVFTDYPKRI
jgi:hypothetical protein